MERPNYSALIFDDDYSIIHALCDALNTIGFQTPQNKRKGQKFSKFNCSMVNACIPGSSHTEGEGYVQKEIQKLVKIIKTVGNDLKLIIFDGSLEGERSFRGTGPNLVRVLLAQEDEELKAILQHCKMYGYTSEVAKYGGKFREVGIDKVFPKIYGDTTNIISATQEDG